MTATVSITKSNKMITSLPRFNFGD